MLVHDAFDWTNAAIGGAGLVLTVATLLVARGARKAALEVRKVVLQRDAADAFLELSGMAHGILEHVELEHRPEAAVRVRDVSERIPKYRARFENFLGPDSAKLHALESRYQQLANMLSTLEVWDDPERRRTVTDMARTASGEISEVCGRLLKGADKGEQ